MSTNQLARGELNTETVFAVGRSLAADPDANFSALPYLEPFIQFPERLPELEPPHPVKTAALMNAVNKCVQLNYFTKDSDEYRNFQELCDEFDREVKSLCDIWSSFPCSTS
jgi:hypothetical protein